jgi:hypothetical protein
MGSALGNWFVKFSDPERQEPRVSGRVAGYIPPIASGAMDGAHELMRLVWDKQKQQQKPIALGMAIRKAKATAKAERSNRRPLVFAFD